MVFSDTPHLLKTFLLRRASSRGVIISDRFALEISSRGSSKLTSEFSASEIFVQRLPGSSVTSQRRRQYGGGGKRDFALPPAKRMILRGCSLQPRAWATCLPVTTLISLPQDIPMKSSLDRKRLAFMLSCLV